MIKEADETYFEEIANLEARCFVNPWAADDIGSLSNNFTHILCEFGDDGLIKGYIFYITLFENAEIFRLCVDPEARRQGIGEALLRQCIKDATERGCEDMFLDVRTKNEGAIALYRKAGFSMIAERAGYYENGDNAFIFIKDLRGGA